MNPRDRECCRRAKILSRMRLNDSPGQWNRWDTQTKAPGPRGRCRLSWTATRSPRASTESATRRTTAIIGALIKMHVRKVPQLQGLKGTLGSGWAPCRADVSSPLSQFFRFCRKILRVPVRIGLLPQLGGGAAASVAHGRLGHLVKVALQQHCLRGDLGAGDSSLRLLFANFCQHGQRSQKCKGHASSRVSVQSGS